MGGETAVKIRYRPGNLARLLMSKAVLREMSRVITNDPKVRVLGPVLAAEENSETLQALKEFRRGQYEASSATYLNNVTQTQLETRLNLDERSRHFYARNRRGVIATLRVTPHPFELSQLTAELSQVSALFQDYLELSRLVVAPEHRGSGVGKKLCYAAMLWAASGEYKGFIAICREHRREEFSRFGLEPFENRAFEIPERDHGSYRFMCGSWRKIICGTGTHYAKKRIKRRFIDPISRRIHEQ